MSKQGARFILVVAFALLSLGLHAQTPQQIVQQVVNAELAADQYDHSNWIYLEKIEKPKEHRVQWVATTQKGDVDRVLENSGQTLSEPQQRDLIHEFLQDTKAQNKQISETSHDVRQIDDLMRLLPVAFVWTQMTVTTETTGLHFEPAPNFRPPTREARVFSGMTGDLIVDNQQHRVRSMQGHLIRDVTFGGGLLGRLKKGSSFFIEQEAVGPSLWQLTTIRIHLIGSAFLFKSVSLQEDDERSKFQFESPTVSLDQAADGVMKQIN